MRALATPELRERVERAHELAIDRALAYVISVVAMVRERVDTDTVVHARAASVIATSWRHATARAVADRPPDPQLHSHVLLHGAVRRDGRVVAIDSRAWFVHRRELGAAYRTELARELAALGFAIRRGTGRGGRYFEIEGVPAGLIDRWSGRRHQVHAAIDQRLADKQAALEATVAAGGMGAQAAAGRLGQLRRSTRLRAGEDRLLGVSTRSVKRPLQTSTDLDRLWAQTGRHAKLDSQGIERLRCRESLLWPAEGAELLGRLTEFDATFAQHEARAVALEAGAGTPIADSLRALEHLRSDGQLLDLADGRQTTRRHRHAERQTVALARRLAAGRVDPIAPMLVAEHRRRLDDELRAVGGRLSAEQQAALLTACSDAQLVVIQGQAGTGKSTVLVAVGRAHRDAGRRIIVTSTAALAAQRLAGELADAGVEADCYSTSALHAAIGAGRLELGPAATVIHDEAALASTREQHRLLAAAEVSGARLIEVGDPRQSQPVGAGGLWAELEQAAGAQKARVQLTRNVRARDACDRRDQRRFRDGHHCHAIRGYATQDRVTIIRRQRQAEDAALEAAHADRHQARRWSSRRPQTSTSTS
jgi:hypothetical protein